MLTQEQHILEAAVLALGKTTGIEAHTHATGPGRDRRADAIIEMETNCRTYRFGAEIKTVDRFETPAMVKAQNKGHRDPPLLVAPYITREIAERCRQLQLPYH